MKIEDAKLCLSCDEVFDGNILFECPVCAKGPSFKMQDWLGRKVAPEIETVKILRIKAGVAHYEILPLRTRCNSVE